MCPPTRRGRVAPAPLNVSTYPKGAGRAKGTGDYTNLEGTGTVHVEVGTAAIATYNGEMSN